MGAAPAEPGMPLMASMPASPAATVLDEGVPVVTGFDAQADVTLPSALDTLDAGGAHQHDGAVEGLVTGEQVRAAAEHEPRLPCDHASCSAEMSSSRVRASTMRRGVPPTRRVVRSASGTGVISAIRTGGARAPAPCRARSCRRT
jgi:hypothetical protein